MKKIVVIVMVMGLLLTGCTYSLGDVGLDLDYRFSNYEEFKEAVDELDSDYFSVERIEQFELSDVDSLETSTIFEDVDVYREDRDDIEIRYFGIFSNKTSDKKPKYTIEDKNNATFLVKWEKLVGSNHARMEVYLPNDYDRDLEIRSVSGDLKADLIISDEFEINTVSGDINLASLQAASVNVKSISGDVTIDSADVDDINLETVSGYISFSVGKQEGDISVSSISGDVSAKVKNINSSIDFTSISGDVSSIDLDETEKKKENTLKGSIKEGKYHIDIDTVSGDINFE